MDERALRVLEFLQFLQALKKYAVSDVGQTLCLALRPVSEKGAIDRSLREVAEAHDILQEEGGLPLQGTQEVRPLLDRARAEGACLPPEELIQICSTLVAAGRVQQFLRRKTLGHPLMAQWLEKIPEVPELIEDLKATFGPRGEILDTASPGLQQIRQAISRLRSRIRQALESLWDRDEYQRIFQEEIITLRNERYVVAVKAEFKNNLSGIIHDQSQSKATYFIEPLATVEDNNDLHLLLKDEKEEERRILLALTAQIQEHTEEISRAVEVLGHLDLVFAKAKWAQAFRGTIPLLNDQGSWHLRDARHPLLEPQSVVPIDLHLDPGKSTVIITGANTGGKTVALKTLGLLTLMAQCGIPVPAAEGSEVAVFHHLFADIGDEQNIQAHLSTFSAWTLAVAKILREADPSSLVLMDEVGGGTDPTEGAALTMALLDELRARGAKTVVTTHLHGLKAYGAIHPDVVNVSVEFNPGTLRPTYRLVYGRPGESYALLMAEKWGFPHEVVERAQAYLGEGDRKVSQLLQSLEQTQQEMEAKRAEAEQMRQEAEKAREESEALKQRAQKEEEALLAKAREEAQRVVHQAKEELRGLINEFKAKGRTDIHRLEQKIRAEEQRIGTLGSPKEGQERAFKSRGNLGADAKGSRLGSSRNLAAEAWEDPEETAKTQVRPSSRGLVQYEIPSAARELKVIGLHVEEALPLVDKAIDDAYLGGLKELEVIHGAGTGRLRQAIRQQLHDHVFVRAFRPGGPGRGGDGMTVVEIGPVSLASSPKVNPDKKGGSRSKR